MNRTGDGYLVRSLAGTHRAGGRIARHEHPWGQLVYAIRGVMRVTTPDAAWTAPPTRAIWLPPHVPHEILMQGETAMLTLYLSPEQAADLPARTAVLEISPLLRELILHILKVGMLAPGRPEHERLAGLLNDLLVKAPPQDLFLPLPQDARALAMAARLQAAPGDQTDLSALSRDAGASLRTLQRLFPSQTGLTLEAWRQKARLISAVAALSGGTSVTAAALDCGYDSVSAFITAFKRQFGMTPGRYRA